MGPVSNSPFCSGPNFAAWRSGRRGGRGLGRKTHFSPSLSLSPGGERERARFGGKLKKDTINLVSRGRRGGIHSLFRGTTGKPPAGAGLIIDRENNGASGGRREVLASQHKLPLYIRLNSIKPISLDSFKSYYNTAAQGHFSAGRDAMNYHCIGDVQCIHNTRHGAFIWALAVLDGR